MKMEIELTDKQAEKVEILKENGIEVGEAIDILFEMKEAIIDSSNQIIDSRIDQANQEKDNLQKRLSEIDEEISFFEKLKDNSINPINKQKIIGKEYGDMSKTYDETVQDEKHKFKWTKNIFKF
nr:hypothetical protein [uncultured Methanobrevibacter sp.]